MNSAAGGAHDCRVPRRSAFTAKFVAAQFATHHTECPRDLTDACPVHPSADYDGNVSRYGVAPRYRSFKL